MLAVSSLMQAAALAAMLVLTAGSAIAKLATIEGEASYRERIALRPGAVLEVELLDISLADAPSQRFASIRIRAQSQVPIPFVLHYEPAMIEPNRTYAVTAKLILQGKVIFRSDAVHPVLTRGAGDTVEILMVRTGGRRVPPASTAAGSTGNADKLVGPTWVAEDIGGGGVIDYLQSHITFMAEGPGPWLRRLQQFHRRLRARQGDAGARAACQHQEGLSARDHEPRDLLPSGAGPDPRLPVREWPADPTRPGERTSHASLAPRLTGG